MVWQPAQEIGFGEALNKTEDDLLEMSTFAKETEKEKSQTGSHEGHKRERGEGSVCQSKCQEHYT